MKTIDNLSLTLIFLVLIICFSCSKEENEKDTFSKETYFYYSQDSIIYLEINSEMILVDFNDSTFSESLASNLLKDYPEIDLDNTSIENRTVLYLKSGITKTEYLNLLSNLNSFNLIKYATPSFSVNNGIMFLTNKFFIKTTMTENEFQNFLENYTSQFSKVEDYYSGRLFIANDIKNGFEALDFANEIDQQNGIEYSQPSFARLMAW